MIQQYYNVAEQFATVRTVGEAKTLIETYCDCLDLVERYLPKRFSYLIKQVVSNIEC